MPLRGPKLCKGVSIVMHVALALFPVLLLRKLVVIKPAVDGTLNVLKAAFEHRDTVKRVVVTELLQRLLQLYEPNL